MTLDGLTETGAAPSVVTTSALRKIACYAQYRMSRQRIRAVIDNGQNVQTFGRVQSEYVMMTQKIVQLDSQFLSNIANEPKKIFSTKQRKETRCLFFLAWSFLGPSYWLRGNGGSLLCCCDKITESKRLKGQRWLYIDQDGWMFFLVRLSQCAWPE